MMHHPIQIYLQQNRQLNYCLRLRINIHPFPLYGQTAMFRIRNKIDANEIAFCRYSFSSHRNVRQPQQTSSFMDSINKTVITTAIQLQLARLTSMYNVFHVVRMYMKYQHASNRIKHSLTRAYRAHPHCSTVHDGFWLHSCYKSIETYKGPNNTAVCFFDSTKKKTEAIFGAQSHANFLRHNRDTRNVVATN